VFELKYCWLLSVVVSCLLPAIVESISTFNLFDNLRHKRRSLLALAMQTFAVAARVYCSHMQLSYRCASVTVMHIVTQVEHGRNMLGPSTYSSFHQSFYGSPSFGHPQTQTGTDVTPITHDVFYAGGSAFPGYDSLQPAESDFQPPYFPPPNPPVVQPVGGSGLFAHHHRPVPVAAQQPLQPVVDQSMYWSHVNAAGLYTGGGTTNNVGQHHAIDQQKTYHALQQVTVICNK